MSNKFNFLPPEVGVQNSCGPAPDFLRKDGGLSLRENFSWNLAGNIVYGGCQWGMLVVLAKLTNPEMVGRFALALAVTGPVVMLSNLQLSGLLATDTRGEYQFGHYLGLRLTMTALALMIIAVVGFWGNYSLQASLMLLAVGFSKALESISDIYFGFMQRHEHMDRIGKSRIIKGILSLLVFAIMVHLTSDALLGVLGLALAWALMLAVYDIPNANLIMKLITQNPDFPSKTRHDLLPLFKWQPLLSLFRLAMPLGVVMGVISLQPNIPRYLIDYYWGEGDLGIFSAMAYLIVVGITIVGAMGQSAAPRLANYYAAGHFSLFRQLLLRLVLLGLAIGAVGIAVALLGGRPLLFILYGPDYTAYVGVFVWLMVAGAMAFVASFLGYGMTAARYFKIQIPLYTLVTGSTAITAWLLIPEKGVLGAALALAIGSLFQIIGSTMVIVHAIYSRNAN